MNNCVDSRRPLLSIPKRQPDAPVLADQLHHHRSGGGLAWSSTRFSVSKNLERDASLSAQFIQSIAVGEIRHHDPTGMKMGDVLFAVRYGMPAMDR